MLEISSKEEFEFSSPLVKMTFIVLRINLPSCFAQNFNHCKLRREFLAYYPTLPIAPPFLQLLCQQCIEVGLVVLLLLFQLNLYRACYGSGLEHVANASRFQRWVCWKVTELGGTVVTLGLTHAYVCCQEVGPVWSGWQAAWPGRGAVSLHSSSLSASWLPACEQFSSTVRLQHDASTVR